MLPPEIGFYVTWKNNRNERVMMEIEKIEENGDVLIGTTVNFKTLQQKVLRVNRKQAAGKIFDEHDTAAIKFFKFVTKREDPNDLDKFGAGDKIPV